MMKSIQFAIFATLLTLGILPGQIINGSGGGGDLSSGPVTSLGGVSSIADNALTIAKTSGLQDELDGKVDDSQLSTTGGASKVLQYTANGDLTLLSAAPTGTALGIGGVFMPDGERLWFLNNTNKADGASIQFATDHDAYGGEFYISSPNRIALLPGVWGGIQIGIASGNAGRTTGSNMQFAYMQQRGYTTDVDGRRLTDSLPLYFQPGYWNAGLAANAISLAGSIQAVAVDQAGNSTLDFSIRAVQPNNTGADGVRPLDMQLTPAGLWEAGKAPAFESLTAASNIFTQTCSIYKSVQSAKFTLGATNTLAFSGLESGMRGVIYVAQDITGSKTLNLPASPTPAIPSTWTAGLADLSTAGSSITRLSWEYDGTNIYYSSVKGLAVPLDSDYSAYIAATGATDTDNLLAFITGLKSMGLWSTSVCWPLRNNQNHGTGTVVKSLGGLGTFDGTISGGASWGAAGITFDGTDDRISISNPVQSTSLSAISLFSVFDSDATANRFVFGSYGSATTGIGPSIFAGGSPTGGSVPGNMFFHVSLDGTNTNTTGIAVSGGNTGSAQSAALAYSPAEIRTTVNATSGTSTPLRASAWNNASTWEMGARNNAGTYGYWFVGSQAFHFVTTTALSAAQHTALRDLYKTTLGVGLSLP